MNLEGARSSEGITSVIDLWVGKLAVEVEIRYWNQSSCSVCMGWVGASIAHERAQGCGKGTAE